MYLFPSMAATWNGPVRQVYIIPCLFCAMQAVYIKFNFGAGAGAGAGEQKFCLIAYQKSWLNINFFIVKTNFWMLIKNRG